MGNGLLTEKEIKEKIEFMRYIYIETALDGKKSKWEDLSFWEKRKVDRYCKMVISMRSY